MFLEVIFKNFNVQPFTAALRRYATLTHEATITTF
jgi:hypothetical protein